ncbi:MAG: helix-turn-helix domain-containing protein [Thermodesulfobacteriota bacterium]
MEDKRPLKDILTIEEVADFLRMKKSSLYAKVEARQIPCLHIGRLLRFRRSDIEVWLEKLKAEPVERRRRAAPRSCKRIDVDVIVQRAVAEAKAAGYNSHQGKPDQIRGLRKEV